MILTLGDVAGKGSPAALLMALLLAVLRTLVDEKLEPRELIARLNLQICRHSPGSRFITLFYGVYTPATGALTYVNAGQHPPLLRRARRHARAARMAPASRSACSRVRPTKRRSTTIGNGETLVLYSDGITEAENPEGQPFEESGLERVVTTYTRRSPRRRSAPSVQGGRAHARDSRFTDDLTILILKRLMPAA